MMQTKMFKIRRRSNGQWILMVLGFNYPMRYSSLDKAVDTMKELTKPLKEPVKRLIKN